MPSSNAAFLGHLIVGGVDYRFFIAGIDNIDRAQQLDNIKKIIELTTPVLLQSPSEDPERHFSEATDDKKLNAEIWRAVHAIAQENLPSSSKHSPVEEKPPSIPPPVEEKPLLTQKDVTQKSYTLNQGKTAISISGKLLKRQHKASPLLLPETFSLNQKALIEETANKQSVIGTLTTKEKKRYQELKAKHPITLEERQELDKLFKRTHTSDSKKEKTKTEIGLQHEVRPCQDFETTITVDDNELEPAETCTVKHEMFYNSPFNGQYYWAIDPTTQIPTLMRVEDGVTSSNDRTATGIMNGQKITITIDDETQTLCYIGRPDSVTRLQEVCQMIGESGRITDAHTGKNSQLFLVSSLESSRRGSEEREYIENEARLLSDVRTKETITFNEDEGHLTENRDDDVHPLPLFTNHKLGEHSWLRDDDFEFDKSQDALQILSGKLQQEIDKLGNGSQKAWLTALKNTILPGHYKKLLPEEKVALEYLVCQELNIPYVIHCKSCLDRTAIAVSIMIATQMMKQLIKIDSRDPTNPRVNFEFMQSSAFKNRFATALLTCIPNTKISRDLTGLQFVLLPDLSTYMTIYLKPILGRLLPDNFGELIMNPRYSIWEKIRHLADPYNFQELTLTDFTRDITCSTR
jgi:hypothetical protein